jgi:hypothetical protein
MPKRGVFGRQNQLLASLDNSEQMFYHAACLTQAPSLRPWCPSCLPGRLAHPHAYLQWPPLSHSFLFVSPSRVRARSTPDPPHYPYHHDEQKASIACIDSTPRIRSHVQSTSSRRSQNRSSLFRGRSHRATIPHPEATGLGVALHRIARPSRTPKPRGSESESIHRACGRPWEGRIEPQLKFFGRASLPGMCLEPPKWFVLFQSSRTPTPSYINN